MNKIFITGDIHGEIDIHKLSTKHWKEGAGLDKSDYLIIAGDFGFIWDNQSSPREIHWLKWLEEKPWTTLFIDGNHENHDRLEKLPLVDMFGSKVGKVNDSIFHLKRGEIYTIHGKTFFTFGGGFSVDKERRKEFISWWSQEMPSHAEEMHGFDTLKKVNYEVDYIITHECPQFIKETYMQKYLWPEKVNTTSINMYFDEVMRRTDFKKWYFGHFHKDERMREFRLLYYDIEEII